MIGFSIVSQLQLLEQNCVNYFVLHMLIATRFNMTYDFGYVALDLDWTYPEDSGIYMCKATNKHGTDSTQAQLSCQGKKNHFHEL